ncbi:uncharacterized protein LOC135081622 [Ostrinia nubilalis]|uniref:uncharacterized protein LOC114355921 n=1 Tax=Ostrinia furnacalis TaxID=93504 RepID=UPI00103ACB20|nr:uncharacterized protein LOC114355921 [Ostrinia furnacalis]
MHLPLVILLILSAQPPVTCDYVTTIVSSSGLYFDKLLDVKFINSYWKVVTYLDIGHINPNLDKVEVLFEKITAYCNSFASSKINSECTNSLTALRNQHLDNVNKFSSVSYLLSDDEPKGRVKRGLIDFGGSLLKTFFGTLDTEDAVKFSQAINDVQSDEKKLAYLMKDNIHVIKSTISSFNNSISKVNENEKHLMKNMEVIHNILENVSNSNDKLEIKSQINSLLTSLESIILTLSFDIDDVNNAILFAKLNVLHPTVLNPYQLYSELDKHRNSLPKHSELPVSLTLQNIHELIDISKLICFYHLNKIIIIVNIPLVLPQVYNLHNVIPLPAPYDISKPDTFVLIAPNTPYIAITGDHMFYSQIRDLSECKMISEKCYVCELVNVYSTIANPTCETILLTEIVNRLPDNCNVKLLHGSVDVFHKLTNNRWLFVQSEPGKCHISCDSQSDDPNVILFGTGILTIPKNCKAFYKTLQFIPTGETVIKNISNTISNFNIILDDCCEKAKHNRTLNKLPFSKLENVNNLDSLLHASLHLDSLEQDLNKLDNPSHLERYGIHYISVSYFISGIFLIYIIYRNRRLFCKSNRNQRCCIQIFNQCNNKKSVKTTQSIRDVEDSSGSDEHEPRSTPSPMRRNIIIAQPALHAHVRE